MTSILRTGAASRIILEAGVLGNFIMEALAVQFVRLSTPVAFMVGGSTFRLQAILDSLMPNLLPLLLVLLVWWLVARKNVSPTKVMAAIILIGILQRVPRLAGAERGR